MGIRVCDLDDMTIGECLDIMIEAGNDKAEYKTFATQADMDKY